MASKPKNETPTEEKPVAPTTDSSDKYNTRRWTLPSKRAAGYAQDRKKKMHTYGPKEGKPLRQLVLLTVFSCLCSLRQP